MTEALPPRPAARRYGLGALSHRNFRLFFIGQGISLVGTWMQNVGEGWLILTLTNSPFYVGLTSALSSLGVLLFSLYAGVIADRVDKRRVIIFMQIAFMLEAFTVAILVWTGVVAVWQVLVLATILGIASAFDIPMRQSFLVEMVGKEDLMNAIALNSSVFNGARVIGPAIAGVLIGAVGIAWCFFANGVSYLAVIAGLSMMRLGPRPRPDRTASTLDNVLEGFPYVRRTTPIRALLLLVRLVSLVGMPYTVLMPLFADAILHGGARGLGVLMGATGVGALLGALIVASRPGLRGLGKVTAAAAAGFGVCLMLFAFSRWFWFSVAVLVPTGLCMMLQMA